MITAVPSRRPSYRPLAADDVARALADLPHWRGDTARLVRTVRPADLWTLLEQVADVEAELDHHTVVDLEAGTVTFTLWSHVCDAVTEVDVALARRLDAVLGD